jgi:uncharacterized phage-like protein YoqJ
MIITFFGHSTVTEVAEVKKLLLEMLNEVISKEDKNTFYLGGYGDFDNIAAEVCREIKSEYKNAETVFVTPYFNELQQKKIKELEKMHLYDSSIYPPIENVPLHLAIIKRNEWMAENADLVIVYVKYSHGGAYRAMNYAVRKGKKVINLIK